MQSGPWVLVRLRVRAWAGGWCIEDAEARSAGGLFLAVGRQMQRGDRTSLAAAIHTLVASDTIVS
jgi:hypothetical protein